MSPYRRNVLVGITVLASLLILGWMIVQFGDRLATPFSGQTVPITFKADRADGINQGSAIKYKGVQIGTVSAPPVLMPDDRVLIQAELQAGRSAPANVVGFIRLPNLLGANAVIDLELDGAAPSDVRIDGGEELVAQYMGSGIIPQEISDLATEMRGAVAEFRASGVVNNFNKLMLDIDEQALKLGETLDAINAVVGEESTQTDVRVAIAQFRETAERANRIAANFEEVGMELKVIPGEARQTLADVRGAVGDARGAINSTRDEVATVTTQINQNLDRLSLIMADVKSVTAKVDAGQGTAGQLVNDPRLYATLVDATELLAATIRDVQRVVQQIEQEGVTVRLR